MLKECPFCGSNDLEEKFEGDTQDWRCSIKCKKCEAVGPAALVFELAWEYWSDRSGAAVSGAANEEK